MIRSNGRSSRRSCRRSAPIRHGFKLRWTVKAPSSWPFQCALSRRTNQLLVPTVGRDQRPSSSPAICPHHLQPRRTLLRLHSEMSLRQQWVGRAPCRGSLWILPLHHLAWLPLFFQPLWSALPVDFLVAAKAERAEPQNDLHLGSTRTQQ
jgi:hypothetical protein